MNQSHAIQFRLAEGDYDLEEKVPTWSNKLVSFDNFRIMGYLYRGKDPVNVVALKHNTSPEVREHPVYPLKMHMTNGGISQPPNKSYVTHLGVVNVPHDAPNVIRWDLGKEFKDLVQSTQRLTGEIMTVNARNIFYQKEESYVIFPLSGDVLRVVEI